MSKFVVITPAHNEEGLIAKTIQSMVAQTRKPTAWVIVNDGSTDRTAEIIAGYAKTFTFIRAVNLQRDSGRHFGKKVAAFNLGRAHLRDLDFDYIGNLDADISFGPEYFENILGQFELDPKLGVAGGIVYTRMGEGFFTQDGTLDSVGGAVQMFRRGCFDQVGGYLPLEYGGEDAAVEITARMNGWKVRKFPENRVYEDRQTGSANATPLIAKMREGRRFYTLGYSLAFYCARCLYRVKYPPLLLGSAAALLGFLVSAARRRPKALSPDVVRYLRTEQRKKLIGAIPLLQPRTAGTLSNLTL